MNAAMTIPTTDKLALLSAALRLELVTEEDIETRTPDEALAHADECADALRHCNADLRAMWIAARDASRLLANDDGSDDRFGFRAGARVEARNALMAIGIASAY